MHEVWQAILTVLAADSTLTAMLGDGANGVFYDEGSAPEVLSFPAVRLRLLGDVPSVNVSGLGLYRPRLEVSVFGVDQALNQRVQDRLDAVMTVPYQRAQGFNTTTYLVTHCVRQNSMRVPTRIERDSRQVIQLVSDWALRVRKKA